MRYGGARLLGLENRRWSNPTVGSNPTLSANKKGPVFRVQDFE
jgi:hypothetical protein